MIIVILYLTAIVAANLSVTYFGPQFAMLNSFVLIGLDITARDALHERWHGKHLWRNMALLILAGGALSVSVNFRALPIALASCAAFCCATAVDALTYHLLRNKARLLRINGSNVPSAAVDSIVFPALAFGFPLLIPVMVGQFVAKVAGGLIWSLVLARLFKKKKPAYGWYIDSRANRIGFWG
jgi:queuosine precursor transporter